MSGGLHLFLLGITSVVMAISRGSGIASDDSSSLSEPSSSRISSEDSDKRGWNALHNIWGKRGTNWDQMNPLAGKSDWSSLSGMWGKRGWNNLSGMWGKRGWNNLSGMWGKRDWNNLSGMWGKRDWNNLSGMWGKRGWNDLSGVWGKKSDWTNKWNESPAEYLFRNRMAHLSDKKDWNSMKAMWGKRSEVPWDTYGPTWYQISGDALEEDSNDGDLMM